MNEQVLIRAEIIGGLPSGKKLVHLLCNGAEGIVFYSDDKSLLKASERPTVDAVEVVRCRECMHYDERFNPNTKNYCYVDGGRTHRIMPPDGFCSYGERRTE